MVSGENIVVLGQIKALNAYGHEVKLFSRHTDIEQKMFFFAARSGYRVISGSGFNFKKDIKYFNPDLVLVHNLFPNISSRWLERVTARRIIFLHNHHSNLHIFRHNFHTHIIFSFFNLMITNLFLKIYFLQIFYHLTI